MKREFAPYELAVRLEVLGFDKPCFGQWLEKDEREGGGIVLEMWNDEDTYFEVKSSTKAPTFSQAFRWFREKYGLQGYVYSTTVRGGKEGKHFSDYCWHINGIDMPFLSTDSRDMENVSYEEAELACLTKLIEIVETKSR